MGDYIIGLDTDLLLWINSHNAPFWDNFMYTVSGKLIWVPFYITLLYAIFRSYGFRTMIVMGIMTALAITAADQVCSSLIRPTVERMRPSTLDNPVSDFVHIVNGYRGRRYGFPSCHAANTFALVALTSLLFRRWRYTLFIVLWAAMVCYSRIYLGVHYPGDILAGLTVGTICGMACYLATAPLVGIFLHFKQTERGARKVLYRHKLEVPSIHTSVGKNQFTWRPTSLPIVTCVLTIISILIYSAIITR